MPETTSTSSAPANIPSKPSSSIIGIIYPPPEVRSMFILCISSIITLLLTIVLILLFQLTLF